MILIPFRGSVEALLDIIVKEGVLGCGGNRALVLENVCIIFTY